MNRKLTGWKLLTIPALVLGGIGASACSDVKDAAGDVCGACGEIQYGDVSISGSAQLDGFFAAVSQFTSATGSVTADYNVNLAALGDAFGVKAEASGLFDVDKVVAAIKADFTANLEGGIQVNYKPPACQANVDVSVQATAKCEAKAGCDVKVDPGEASVTCEGSCTGECTGGCDGDVQCAVTAPSATCTGSCEGTCELTAAAACEGTCHGTCDGNCTVKDNDGNCQGSCDGNCKGSCEFTAAAKCEGKCSGSCVVKGAEADCKGSVKCDGKCTGSCKGGCSGNFKPPSASGSCDAEADCQASASAQANASLDCTPPSLDVSYGFKAGVNGSAQAAFIARIGVLKARGAAIVQGAAKLSALVDGKVDGKVVFDPSPLASLQTSVKGFASADAIAKFDIPAGKIPCAVSGFSDSIKALGDAGSDLGATISGQAKIVAVVTGG